MAVEVFSDKKEQEAAVESFLLQQYRNALVRLMVTQLSGRILFIGLISSLVFIHSPSKGALMISFFVSFFLTFAWLAEHRTARATIISLETAIARVTGGLWEDFYIRVRYESRDNVPNFFSMSLRYEPFFWFMTSFLTLLYREFMPSLFS